MRRADYDVFLEKFQPNGSEDESIVRYHWEGKDRKELDKHDVHNIWTIISGDNGKLYLSPGWRFINRMDYVICKNPWKEGQRDYLY